MKYLKDLFKNLTDLQKRILFTLGALIVYRIGSYIPLPGVDGAAVGKILGLSGGNEGLMGMFNSFSGGALERMSVLALNIFPYISASIVIQLLTATSKSLSDLRKEGESGRVKLNQYTRYLAVFLAIVQGWAVTRGLESLSGGAAVINKGWIFQLTATVALVGGTVFIMWLAEQITARGIGQGASLLIFAGIISDLPDGISMTLKAGHDNPAKVALVVALVVGMVALIAFMEQAQRRLQILYPRQAMANGVANTNVSYLPLKVNMSGVMGPVFASSIMMLPAFVTRFVGNQGNEFVQIINRIFSPGNWIYISLYTLLIVFFAFFQTAVVFNSEETSNNLKNMGGYIPGVRPGEQTMKYLDEVVARTTTIGSVYLVVICVLPLLLRENGVITGIIGGTSVLIVVGVILDTMNQIKSYLVEKQYNGIVSKIQKKGRFR